MHSAPQPARCPLCRTSVTTLAAKETRGVARQAPLAVRSRAAALEERVRLHGPPLVASAMWLFCGSIRWRCLGAAAPAHCASPVAQHVAAFVPLLLTLLLAVIKSPVSSWAGVGMRCGPGGRVHSAVLAGMWLVVLCALHLPRVFERDDLRHTRGYILAGHILAATGHILALYCVLTLHEIFPRWDAMAGLESQPLARRYAHVVGRALRTKQSTARLVLAVVAVPCLAMSLAAELVLHPAAGDVFGLSAFFETPPRWTVDLPRAYRSVGRGVFPELFDADRGAATATLLRERHQLRAMHAAMLPFALRTTKHHRETDAVPWSDVVARRDGVCASRPCLVARAPLQAWWVGGVERALDAAALLGERALAWGIDPNATVRRTLARSLAPPGRSLASLRALARASGRQRTLDNNIAWLGVSADDTAMTLQRAAAAASEHLEFVYSAAGGVSTVAVTPSHAVLPREAGRGGLTMSELLDRHRSVHDQYVPSTEADGSEGGSEGVARLWYASPETFAQYVEQDGYLAAARTTRFIPSGAGRALRDAALFYSASLGEVRPDGVGGGATPMDTAATLSADSPGRGGSCGPTTCAAHRDGASDDLRCLAAWSPLRVPSVRRSLAALGRRELGATPAPVSVRLSILGAGTAVRLHYSPASSLILQVTGEARATLLSPAMLRKAALLHPAWHPSHRQSRLGGVALRRALRSLDGEEALLAPGTLITVPPLWGLHVQSLTPSVQLRVDARGATESVAAALTASAAYTRSPAFDAAARLSDRERFTAVADEIVEAVAHTCAADGALPPGTGPRVRDKSKTAQDKSKAHLRPCRAKLRRILRGRYGGVGNCGARGERACAFDYTRMVASHLAAASAVRGICKRVAADAAARPRSETEFTTARARNLQRMLTSAAPEPALTRGGQARALSEERAATRELLLGNWLEARASRLLRLTGHGDSAVETFLNSCVLALPDRRGALAEQLHAAAAPSLA